MDDSPQQRPLDPLEAYRKARLKPRVLEYPEEKDNGLCPDLEQAEYPPPPEFPEPVTQYDRLELAALLAEAARRRKEALKIYRAWSVPEQFHASKAGIRLPRGSNRGGKTLAACVEIARAVTGRDPYNKYPRVGRVIVVGKDLLHCSKVIYRKLFKPGAFKIIRDPATHEYRPFVPDEDAELEYLVEPSPPLIPRRFYSIKDMSWNNKREEILRSVKFNTGWEMTFFSGEGEPPQGWDVDLALFDEEIPHPRWYPEIVPRLVDRKGKFIWSFTPQAGTIVAYELAQEAEQQLHDENPRVAEFFMKIEDNPYISKEAKQQFFEDLKHDEDELKVRYYGDFALKGMRVYPTFNKLGPHKIATFEVPDDWTTTVAIDPGRQVSAALFRAVPPPHTAEYDRPVIFGEVYSKKTEARRFAREMKEFLGHRWVLDWLIDHHQGRKVEASGKSVEEIYGEAFIEAGLDQNGFKGFIWASDDVAAGKLAASETLCIVEGAPVWYFMTDRLHWFTWEIDRYVDKRLTRGGKVVDDSSRSNLHNHLMDCFRYMAMHPCRYVKPPRKAISKGWTTKIIEAKRKKKRLGEGWGSSVRLG